jgi:YQGE family putative transporter
LLKRIREYAEQRSQRVQGIYVDEKKLSRDAKNTLVIHLIFTIGSSMAGVFLNIYLWRLGNSLSINAYFQMINFVVIVLSFILCGWLVKKYDRIWIYRIGIGLVSFFYLSVVIVQEQVLVYYVLFAIVHGLVMGFYWTGYTTLMYDVSNSHNRIRFLAINMTVFTLGSLSGPVIAGYLIYVQEGLLGYTIVFTIAMILFVIATIISLRISSLHLPKQPLLVMKTLKLLIKHQIWQKLLVSFLIIGLFQGLMTFLPNIMLYRFVPREDLIGYLGMLYSSTTIAVSMVVSRIAQPHQAKIYIFIGGSLALIGAVQLWIHVSLISLIIFMILYSTSAPLIWNALTSNYFGVVSRLPLHGNLRVESIILREVGLNTGRLIALTGLLFYVTDLDSRQLPSILICIAIVQFVIVRLVTIGKIPITKQE